MYKSNRARTRDLLLEYNSYIIPAQIILYDIDVINSWGVNRTEALKKELYNFAENSGYSGTYEEFTHEFGSYLSAHQQQIVFSLFENFPATGNSNQLYFDLTDKILYYWSGEEYVSVNAMLITNTILNGGEA